MSTTIPTEVLALKSRFDQWRATRSHIRERVPDELREAVVKLARRYPPPLIRRVLNVDPWRMNGSITSKPAPARRKQSATFFQLPIEVSAPAPVSTANDATSIRLELERPDGARLTLTVPELDLDSVRHFCADFLPTNKQ